MRQRQVRQHAVRAVTAQVVVNLTNDAVGRSRDAAKTMHGAFGLAGGARGVDDHGQVVCIAGQVARDAHVVGDDVVPFVKCSLGRQRKSNAWKLGWHTM